MSGDIDKTNAALIRKDIEHLAKDVQSGFDGTNRRLDKLNGGVAENKRAIHDVEQRATVIETTCRERSTGYREATKTNAKAVADVVTGPMAKYGAAGIAGLGGATLIIMLLLRAWGYL